MTILLPGCSRWREACEVDQGNLQRHHLEDGAETNEYYLVRWYALATVEYIDEHRMAYVEWSKEER